MCIGGGVGASVDLVRMGRMRSDVKLFSEGNSRWLVEIRKGKEKLVPKDRRARTLRLGTVGGDILSISSGKRLVDAEVCRLAESFDSTLWRMVG
jgi:phosphoribosylformylglycinamidine (FGAM) synthase-like enzyme